MVAHGSKHSVLQAACCRKTKRAKTDLYAKALETDCHVNELLYENFAAHAAAVCERLEKYKPPAAVSR